jgi:UDP-N-acetylmuramoyl-L-alanyl-D-glutamate--2,6-diaminopimelate ligase
MMSVERESLHGSAGARASLSEVLGGYRVEPDVTVTGVHLDSRKVRPGDLFLAIPGDTHDGRQFIEQAVARGAVAVAAEPPVAGFVDALSVPLIEVPDLQQEAGWIAARFYRHPGADLRAIAVTGTNGKTTTSRLIAQLGRRLGRRCGVIGTLGASLSDDITEAGNTTPDAVSVQAQLAEWRDQGVDLVSMEVSSHALVQGRVNGLQPRTAVYTNLSRDHLDYHGDMEAYGRAKLGLFTMTGLHFAVVNKDDEFFPRVQAAIPPGVRLYTYSAAGDVTADLWVESARFHVAGVRGRLCSPWGNAEFDSPLPGDFNLANLAAAVAALALGGEDFAAVVAAVPSLRQVPGRMQSIPNEAGLQVIVDYAHTPDALAQVLRALRTHVPGNLVTVFGCGGDRDPGKRQVMGRIACELSDRVIVTSDNPRSENPQAILRDIETGCTGNHVVLVDRAAAIAAAVEQAVAGDCVVIAGKGHEHYQLIDGERLHFSDEEHALAALARRGGA